MRIKGKEVYVYDIEVFPNCFHCSIKNAKSKERLHYEISSRKNDLLKLVSFFTNAVKDKCIVGYNCIHYDNPIINFIIAQYISANISAVIKFINGPANDTIASAFSTDIFLL